MESSSLNIIFISLWFLLPIIPAYVLFKALPSEAIVSGPFKGLNTNLRGAFAGYFLLVVIAMPVMNGLIKNKYENYEVWNVRGKVIDGETKKPIDITKNPRINVQPSSKVLGAGDFVLQVIGERRGENLIEFPIMEIEADGYMPQSLGILDYKVGNIPKKEFCEELDADVRKASYQTIKLTRIPVEHPTQVTMVKDDSTIVAKN